MSRKEQRFLAALALTFLVICIGVFLALQGMKSQPMVLSDTLATRQAGAGQTAVYQFELTQQAKD
jgi:hypothetical protein